MVIIWTISDGVQYQYADGEVITAAVEQCGGEGLDECLHSVDLGSTM